MQTFRWTQCAAAVLFVAFGAMPLTYAQPARTPQDIPSASPQACPMILPQGTKVTATDMDNGAAINLTIAGDPTGVQAYAERTAVMYNHMAGMQSGMGRAGGGMHGGMYGRGMGMYGSGYALPLVPSRASVEETPKGARIVLVPDDASQIAALRDQARRQAAQMQRGECPLHQSAAG